MLLEALLKYMDGYNRISLQTERDSIFGFTLRKHAYSNVRKNSPPKN